MPEKVVRVDPRSDGIGPHIAQLRDALAAPSQDRARNCSSRTRHSLCRASIRRSRTSTLTAPYPGRTFRQPPMCIYMPVLWTTWPRAMGRFGCAVAPPCVSCEALTVSPIFHKNPGAHRLSFFSTPSKCLFSSFAHNVDRGKNRGGEGGRLRPRFFSFRAKKCASAVGPRQK